MRALADFMNHGTLPFVGRQSEMERLISFWQATPQGHGLRGGLVVGEGGIGKSRLVSEVVPLILRGGGVVVHVKLYRGAVASLVSLVRQSLCSLVTTTHLLQDEPEETVTSIVEALHRLSHLRPTLIIIEDVDKLSPDSVRELGTLIEALGDETLSILCVSRPAVVPIRAVMERYLVEEIELSGLSPGETEELWGQLFHTAMEPEMLAALQESTLGSPLAIRSALRGALKSEAIAYDHANRIWRVTLDLPSFSNTLDRNVQLLSEGMAAHLTADERRAAEQLALLGEAFAVETARATIPDADKAVESLMFKGILAVAGNTLTPLPRSASRFPLLTFTHTIVHNCLTQSARIDTGRLLGVIGNGLPLYSTLPFETVARNATETIGDLGLVRRVIERSLDVTLSLDNGPSRRLGNQAWRTGTVLYEAHREQLQDGGLLCARLLYARLRLLRGTTAGDAVSTIIDDLLNVTADPSGAEIMGYRLLALAWPNRMDESRDYSLLRNAWKESREGVEKYPALRYNNTYMVFLRLTADTATAIGDRPLLRAIEREYEAVTSLQDLPSRAREAVQTCVAPYFLPLFDSADELRRRIDSIPELETATYDREGNLALTKISLFESIGSTQEGVSACDEILPHLKGGLSKRNYVRCAIYRITLLLGAGHTPSRAAAEARALIKDEEAGLGYRYMIEIASRLARALILSGAPEEARLIVEELLGENTLLPAETRTLLGSTDRSLRRRPHATGIAAETPEGIDEARDCPEGIPGKILSLHDILRIHAALAAADTEPAGTTGEELGRAVEQGLEWLREKGLIAFMGPLMKRGEERLGERERETWRERLSGMKGARTVAGADDAARIRISMMGTITVMKPEGEVVIRGLRQRTLLALLVADRMLETPLSHSEFSRIAGTGVDDAEYARKMMNGTIWRLRELLGADAIITEIDTPRLNTNRVQVDLLEARDALHDVRESLRRGTLMRVGPALTTALDISCGNTPFPGLYDTFFEAAREDFEFELHSTTLDSARRLMREGDLANAEEILRRGFESMPDDEETVDLLCETLALRGKRMEAERVRMRNAEAVAL